MLEVDIPNTEFFDEATSSFVVLKGSKLLLEHSLISVSKWEAKWHQPFLHGSEKTPEQMLDYVRRMSIGRPPEDEVLNRLPGDVVQQISEYIEDSMTATTFSVSNRGGSREIITSELVYSWMVAIAVPFVLIDVAISGNVRHNIEPFSPMWWLLWACCWVVAGLYATFSWLRGGQTLGMRPWRLKVTALDGGAPSLATLWRRYALATLSTLAGGLGFWWAWLDRDRLTFHDRYSGTRMVRLPKRA